MLAWEHVWPALWPATGIVGLYIAAAFFGITDSLPAALRSLAFPGISPAPLAGTLPQGTFAPIELAVDWYTGNVVLYTAEGGKLTDLEPTSLVPLAAPEGSTSTAETMKSPGACCVDPVTRRVCPA